MMKKNNRLGIVYSTDPNFSVSHEEPIGEESYPDPSKQKIILRKETKHRAGKMVTLIEGFQASDTDKAEIVKQLKTFCGTGGSYKDAEMVIQGDHREKITAWLNKKGYTNVKQK